MKLFAALGPGDIVAAHRAQINKGEFDHWLPFSGQLLEYCREQGIEILALSYNSRHDSLRDGILQIENRPRWLEKGGGIAFHLSRIAYAFVLAARARLFRADFAIIDSGTTHYFALSLFRFLGIPVAVNFHNVLWPNGFKPKSAIARTILWLDSWFFRSIAAGIVGVSPECGRQAREVSRRALPFFEYRSQYRIGEFREAQRDRDPSPFRILYVGRIEKAKGALDVPAIAQRVAALSQLQIVFDVCGGGGALAELRQIVAENELGNIVFVHGPVPRSELLRRMYPQAHAVIVPTRGTFCEGLPSVCAEAIQSGVPVVTSRLSNAIPVLGAAIIEAEPESIESYASAILKLAEDHQTYERLRNACPDCARQFCDRSKSYPAALDRLIAHTLPNWNKLDSYEPLFARME